MPCARSLVLAILATGCLATIGQAQQQPAAGPVLLSTQDVQVAIERGVKTRDLAKLGWQKQARTPIGNRAGVRGFDVAILGAKEMVARLAFDAKRRHEDLKPEEIPANVLDTSIVHVVVVPSTKLGGGFFGQAAEVVAGVDTVVIKSGKQVFQPIQVDHDEVTIHSGTAKKVTCPSGTFDFSSNAFAARPLFVIVVPQSQYAGDEATLILSDRDVKVIRGE